MSVDSSAEKPYFTGIEKMRFLYLEINAHQASSPPPRHSRTSRVSGHAARTSSSVWFLRRVLRLAFTLLDIKLFDIPQRVGDQNPRVEISHSVGCRHQNVRAHKTNHRKVFGHDFLHAVV